MENEILIGGFLENGVKDAIFQMKHNKARSPDGFSDKFYQLFWSLIKDDLMANFKDFHWNKLPLHSLDFGIWDHNFDTKLKLKEVKQIQQYRPICMLNVSFKILQKYWQIESWV